MKNITNFAYAFILLTVMTLTFLVCLANANASINKPLNIAVDSRIGSMVNCDFGYYIGAGSWKIGTYKGTLHDLIWSEKKQQLNAYILFKRGLDSELDKYVNGMQVLNDNSCYSANKLGVIE